MYKNQLVLTYLLMFIALSLILRIFGVLSLSTGAIFGYAVIFYGLSSVYISFGKNKLQLFFGSVLFLTGIVFFITGNFDFANAGEVAFPASFYIIGLSFLFLFFSNKNDTAFFVLGIIFSVAGLIITFVTGHLLFSEYIYAVIDIAKNYWHIFIIFVIVVLLLNRTGKN